MYQGGILSGLEIKKSVEAGDIIVDPWNPTQISYEDKLNPASYDLTLGNQFAVYENVVSGSFEPGCHGYAGDLLRPRYDPTYSERAYENKLDASKSNKIIKCELESGQPLLLKPGIGYLAHTAERIQTNKFVPIVDGKSSIGRLFIFVHVTAGYGDPGFDGQYTLEIVVIHPTIIYPGMRICQIRFHTLVGDVVTYQNKGNYRGVQAGPVESMAWKMFQKP